MSHPRKLIRDGLTIADQFRLVQQLGKGGMGTVWSADDLRLGRPVAIKFLSSEFYNDEQARQRFAREPRLASKIRSPHVVQVYAQGSTDDDVPYLVMELLEGEDLATRIAREGRCTLAETGSIVEQICRALSRAHREGLVHRDIKPHNIFLTPEMDGQLFVKLLDFGIAKDSGARITSLTLAGEVVGSATYVSPEQLHEANSVGPSTDVWSLGVVIYEMLTGRLPFEGRSLPELFMRVIEGKYPPATEVVRGLPKALDGFFAQVIEANLQKRFQSVDELGAAFAGIVRANSSGLLVKQDSSRTLSAAEHVEPEPLPIATPREPTVEEPATTRIFKAWPRAMLAILLVLGAIAAAVAMRARRETPTVEPSSVRPAAESTSARGAPVGPSPTPEPPPSAAAAPVNPVSAATDDHPQPSPPTAATGLPSGKAAPAVEPARKGPPKLSAPAATTPRTNSTDTPPKSMPHNHGF